MTLTIVTGASANHARSLVNLLVSLRRSEVRAKVIAWDLGLSDEQRARAEPLADEVRRFPFERYPSWVNIAAQRGHYAWKPPIVADVADETGGPVLWLDAGDLVFERDLASLRAALARDGFYSPRSSGDVRKWTHPLTLAYMNVDPELLDRPNRNGAVIAFDPARPGMARMLATWRKLALTRACIAPEGSSRDNHRQDQALLTVLAYQFQRGFGFGLVDEMLGVSKHNDGLPPEELEQRLAELAATSIATTSIGAGGLEHMHPLWQRPSDPIARPARPLVQNRLTEPFERRARMLWHLGRQALTELRGGGAVGATLTKLARDTQRAVVPVAWRRLVGDVAPPIRLYRGHGIVTPLIAGEDVGPLRVMSIAHGTLPIPPHGWGATQRVIWNLHTRMAAQGVTSLVVNTGVLAELEVILEEHRPTLLHVHAGRWLPLLARYLERHPTPVVLTSHDAWAAVVPDSVAEPAALADAVIALSPAIRERMHERGIRHVVYVPNGVDVDVFKPLAKRPKSVAAVAANQGRKRLADVAAFFRDRPDYHLTICGPSTETKVPGRALPRAANIEILGNQPEQVIAKLLGECEFFAHLSEVEASALVTREAMAAGCKVWTTPYCAQDLDAVSLYWEDAVADATLGERARAEAVRDFDWAHIARRTAEVYRATLARWSNGN